MSGSLFSGGQERGHPRHWPHGGQRWNSMKWRCPQNTHCLVGGGGTDTDQEGTLRVRPREERTMSRNQQDQGAIAGYQPFCQMLSPTLAHSLTPLTFLECLLGARHCSECCIYSKEQDRQSPSPHGADSQVRRKDKEDRTRRKENKQVRDLQQLGHLTQLVSAQARILIQVFLSLRLRLWTLPSKAQAISRLLGKGDTKSDRSVF